MNEDISWFIGVTMGDGSVFGRMVKFWNNEEFIINRWTKILETEFGIPKEKIKTRELKKNRNGFKRNKETMEIGVNSVDFNIKVKALFQEILSSNNPEIIKPTLRGIFDAEGHVNGRCEIVIWQRKDEQGNLIAEFLRNGLKQLKIKFVDNSNKDFHILRILGSFRNRSNLNRFSQLIGFSHPKKKEWLDLDLEILSLNRVITEEEIIQFLQEVENPTINNMVKHFKVSEWRIRQCLNNLILKDMVIKNNTFPRRFSLAE